MVSFIEVFKVMSILSRPCTLIGFARDRNPPSTTRIRGSTILKKISYRAKTEQHQKTSSKDNDWNKRATLQLSRFYTLTKGHVGAMGVPEGVGGGGYPHPFSPPKNAGYPGDWSSTPDHMTPGFLFKQVRQPTGPLTPPCQRRKNSNPPPAVSRKRNSNPSPAVSRKRNSNPSPAVSRKRNSRPRQE